MNGILIIDKQQDWTSHDVVAKVRGILKMRAIGHAGTLDPMATGVLPLLVGGATKALDYLPGAKAYIATFRLGITTDTQDITGKIITSVEDGALDVPPEKIQSIIPKFTGAQKQIPPMYSAVKIGGKKLYDIARKGGKIERPPRDIVITKLALLESNNNEHTIEVNCSGGTYIRTICHDIGQKLGCGATMTSLRRTMACGFTLEQAMTLEELQNLVGTTTLSRPPLIPTETIFAHYPTITTTENDMTKIKNGAPFPSPLLKGDAVATAKGRSPLESFVRVYAPDGQFFMLGRVENDFIKQVKRF